MKTFFVFKNGKLVTVIQSTLDNVSKVQIRHLLVEYDHLVEDPQDVEKQIAQWKSEHQ